MCLCMLFAVGLGHFELAEERLRAQRHSVSGFGGGGESQRDAVVFSLGQRAGLMSECGLLFVSGGVVTLVAGPSEPLSGVLYHTIIKPAPL